MIPLSLIHICEALNEAMLKQFDCRYLVTKETGKAGGYEEKVEAAKRADVYKRQLCSGSAVRAFASMLEEDGVRVGCPAKIICIGPVTEKSAEAAGLAVGQSAVEYTAEGIRNVLLADVKAGK